MNKKKILIIDDEKELLDLLREKLELENYEVVTAGDGDEGLAKIESCKPNLIICDVKMPKKDGFAVLKEFRQKENTHIPFIMLTVVDDFDKVKKAYDEEADFYIAKPVEIAKLLNNIRILLNISKSRVDS